MKIVLSCTTFFGVLCGCLPAYAIFQYVPAPSVPKKNDVGQVIFERSNWSANDSEHVRMDREEFLRFFGEGVFTNDYKVYRMIFDSDHFSKPLNDKGGWRYCRGAFAAKGGDVFFFNRPREGVLVITDTKYRTDCLILPEYFPKKVHSNLDASRSSDSDR